MAITKRWGEQNSLIRRVRQHSAVATLFRAPSSTPREGFVLGTVPTAAPFQAQAWTESADAGLPMQEAGSNPSEIPVAPISTPPGHAAQQPLPHVPAAQQTSPAQPVTGARTTSVLQAQPLIPVAFAGPASTSSSHLGEGMRPTALATGRMVEAAQSGQSMSSQPALVQPTPLRRAAEEGLPQQPAPRPVTQQAPIQRAPQQPSPAATPVERGAAEQNHPTAQQKLAPALPQAPVTVQRQPQPTPRQPEAAPSAPGEGLDEPTWSKLQAIYRAHKLREAAEANPSVTSPTPQPQPSAPPVQRAENSRASTPVPTQPTPTPQTSTTAASITDQRAESNGIEDAVRSASTAAPVTPHAVTEPPSTDVSQANGAPNQPSDESVASAVAQTSGDLEEVQLSTTSKTLPEADAVQRAATSPTSQALGAPSAIKRPDGAEPDVTSTALPEPVYEAPTTTPLQAVWPVQRVATSGGVDDFAPKAAVEPLPPVEASIPAHERAEVRRRVETIQANQPTESRIDIVTPRRPRPVRQAQAALMETTNTQPSVESAPPVLQRQGEDQHEPSSPASAATTLAQIDTEIGPLPADLWRLIGEPPPTTPDGGEAVQQANQTPSAPANLQRAPLPAAAIVESPNPMVTDTTPVPPALAAAKMKTAASQAISGPPIVAQPGATQVVQKTSFAQPVDTARPASHVGDEVAPVQALNAENRDEALAAPGQTASLVTAASQTIYNEADRSITPMTSVIEPESHSTSAPSVQRASEPGTTDPTVAALMNLAQTEDNELNLEPDNAMDGAAANEFAAPSTTIEAPQTAAKQRLRKRANPSTTAAVQREDAEPDTESSSAEDAPKQAAKPTGKASSTKIDTDELARQVYSKIKRKLTVERERLR